MSQTRRPNRSAPTSQTNDFAPRTSGYGAGTNGRAMPPGRRPVRADGRSMQTNGRPPQANDRPARTGNGRRPPEPPPRKPFPLWTIPVIITCVGALIISYLFAQQQISGYDEFNEKRLAVSGDTFFGPVYIDDVPLTGLTMDEARETLSQKHDERSQSFELFLSSDGNIWRISSADVSMDWNTEILLQQAYRIGRVGTLDQRYAQITSLREPIILQSEFTYDRAMVRKLTDTVAASLVVAPVDASVVAFDVPGRTFTFSDERAGQVVDREKLYQAVVDALDRERYGETLIVDVEPVAPKITRQILETRYTRVASFTTKTTSDSNRNTNIRLAAEALNGKMIAPGGTVSFNETTGQRTREKGYLEAGAIENGRTVQEVGGGICQVSSTMFNAMLRANCEIVNRKPHAWPSDYVPRGEDATVDWPNLDLVMKNPGDTPIFLTAWYENQTVTVEVYGLSLGDGVSVTLESKTTYEKKPTEVVYTYNKNLAVGTTVQIRKPHTGYTVETYKVWLLNGTETSREKLYTSEYRMINEEYEYNDGNPPG